MSSDPTRTTTLRNRYMREFAARLRLLNNDLHELIVDEDAFGLRSNKPITLNTRFKFLTNDGKLKAFQRWLASQVSKRLLSTDEKGDPWTAKYIQSSYRQGVVRSFIDSRTPAQLKGQSYYLGAKEQFLLDTFSAPESVDKLKLLYTRSYEDLKGVTQKISQDMGRILADGVARGEHPNTVARTIAREIKSIDKTRARTIARTEIINAHSEGQLDGFERLGVQELELDVELLTAGDKRVCPRCNSLAGHIYTTKQARGVIPVHPNCRCCWKPVMGKRKKVLRQRRKR